MKSVYLALLSFLVLPLVQASTNLDIDRAWMRISDPLIMSRTFNRQFAELPLVGRGKDATLYWSSDYWPRNKGGINYRWNAPVPRGFNTVSPTQTQASQMTLEQLKTLSPSEKWDLFIGRYDYPTKTEVNSYASPTRPSWEGICNGWAGAALNHAEPKPITLANPDGIMIPFGSSDIKGLLSWYYAKKFSGATSQMGRRCYDAKNISETCLEDMNAGAFHIVLANRLGEDGISFIADIERRAEVWNHLAYSFKSVIKNRQLPPRATSAPGTVSVVRVATVVNYVFLLTRNTWEPVLGTFRQNSTSKSYEYYLDLDNTGRIIGGDWISRQRPDFLWLERKVGTFRGLFERLPELL